MHKTLFFGTNNAHKLKEIREMLGDEFEVKSFHDFPYIDVEETEPTLEGNAMLKAKAFYEHTGIPCFADDTGLEVAALNGAPGVFSARYAGEEGNNVNNINKLLKELEGQGSRSAQFRTVIAFWNGLEMKLFEGIVKGDILHTPVGTNGFGYDPVFMPHGYEQSFAEMNAETKHHISHRGQAIRKFVQYLHSFL